MDDFELDCSLSRLPALMSPPDDTLVVPSSAPTNSVVLAYVERVVESVQVLDPMTEGMEDVMDILHDLEIPPPVVGEDILAALRLLPKETATRYKAIPDFVPRALKTLNGPDFCLVAHEELAEALHREQVMRGMPHGWGVSDPPPYAIATRLLVSSGVDPSHLPKYKTLPPAFRGRLMHAWHGACKTLGWTPYDPEGDTKADARTQAAYAAFDQTHKKQKP
jgi:hypothetical protein